MLLHLRCFLKILTYEIIFCQSSWIVHQFNYSFKKGFNPSVLEKTLVYFLCVGGKYSKSYYIRIGFFFSNVVDHIQGKKLWRDSAKRVQQTIGMKLELVKDRVARVCHFFANRAYIPHFRQNYSMQIGR